MTVLHVVGYGDSITEGPSSVSIAGGAPGNWFEQWANRLADMARGFQPILSPGFRGLWKSLALAFGSDGSGSAADEWQVDAVAHWSHTSTASTWNKAPHGQMWEGANGSAAIATWTKQAGMAPIVGFDLVYVDGPSSADWQYQIDAGSWTNMGQSNIQDGKLKKFYIASSVTSTVKVRQFNGSTSAGTYLVGLIPYYADPRSTSGMVFHDLGRFGLTLNLTAGICSSNLTGSSTAADPLAFLDSCVLGTNAVAHTPTFATLEFVNDIAFSVSSTQNATDLANFATRFRAQIQIPLISIKPYEFNADATQQSLYRANQDTFLANNSSWVWQIDLFTAYQNLGFGGTGAQNAALTGVLLGDGTHPNNAGSYDIGQRFFEFTRTTLYPTYYQPSWYYASGFTVGSSQVASTDELAGAPVTQFGIVVALLSAAPTLFSPALQIDITVPLLNASATLLSPAVQLDVAVPLLNAAPTLFTPAVRENVTISFLNASPTIFTPGVQLNVALALLNAAPSFPAVQVTTANQVSLTLLDASPTIFTPHVTVGSVSMALDLFDATPTPLIPTVAPGGIVIVVRRLDASPIIFFPIVQQLEITITVPLLNAAATFHLPIVQGGIGPATVIVRALYWERARALYVANDRTKVLA